MEIETYEEYKVRNGITNVHQASVVLGLDAMNIISRKLKEANEALKKHGI